MITQSVKALFNKKIIWALYRREKEKVGVHSQKSVNDLGSERMREALIRGTKNSLYPL